ncbi:MAG: sterol desaturase family protein [Candidatus Cyclobacteriaceae bacterium M2_1C_046]
MIPEITGITVFLYFIATFFLILIIRYFIAAGFFYWYFYKYDFKKWKAYKLTREHTPSNEQYLKEIKWSIITSIIFAIVGVGLIWLYQEGYTAIYTSLDQYGYWFLPVSLLLALFIHETYYYWIHRWMHHPKVFRKVHKVHHDSITPSPWTAFSFHPWEGLLEAIILPLILLIIPMHPYVLFTYLMLMTVSSVINHLDIEIYPESLQKSWVGKWLIGASHHHYHHKEFNTNYGLYFTFWDRWMNTESVKFQQMVREKKNIQSKKDPDLI